MVTKLIDTKSKASVTILPSKTVGTMITAVGKAALKLSGDVHQIAVQCLLHAQEHGDTTLAYRLCDTLNSSRQVALAGGVIRWFDKFSPVAVNLNGKRHGLRKPGKDAKYAPFDIPKAIATPIEDIPENSVLRPFNMAQMFSLIGGGLTERLKDAMTDKKSLKGDDWGHAAAYAEAMRQAHVAFMTANPKPVDDKAVTPPLEAEKQAA